MLTFLTMIGILLVCVVIASFFIPVPKEGEKVRVRNPDFKNWIPVSETNQQYIYQDKEIGPSWLKFLVTKKTKILLGGVGIILSLSNGLFFWADATEQYFLVYPWGQKDAIMTQGIKFKGFAKKTDWTKYIDVKVVTGEEDVSEIEGVMKPIDIRFIDQVTAKVLVSARYQLPTDKESFITMAVKFQSLTNLVNNTLIPATKEQVNNTGYMFKAQDYISGEAQQFRQTLDEQLKNGAYVVEKKTLRDTIWQGDKSRQIKEIKTTYEVEKVLDGVVPRRIPHEINVNKIIVSQVIVDDVELEAAFKQRLEAQRDESAKRQLEQQKIETAKDSQQRILAEGERDKAAERVEQEKAQVKALIAIETKLKQEETNKQLAAIQLETEKINASKLKVAADAQAYEISRKVSAGITPEVRLQMELNAQVKVATEIAKLKLPTTYIAGGTGTNKAGLLESLLGAEIAKSMIKPAGK